MNLVSACRVEPGKRPRLAERAAGDTLGLKDKESARNRLAKNLKRLEALQYLLYAENRRALLLVFQAMDAGGKDGVIRAITHGLNPQGCEVTSFKQPSIEERDHDFLWRCARRTPAYGQIGIWNRSHYEDVLIVRVHDLVPKKVWGARYDQINRFEKNLAENQIHVLKFFLHISKEEQLERFRARLEDPERRWKFSPGDLEERKFWGDYQAAYEEALHRCNTAEAPWHVIPSDRKWVRDLAVTEILIETLSRFEMKFPEPSFDPASIKLDEEPAGDRPARGRGARPLPGSTPRRSRRGD